MSHFGSNWRPNPTPVSTTGLLAHYFLKLYRLTQFYYLLTIITSPQLKKISKHYFLKHFRSTQFYYLDATYDARTGVSTGGRKCCDGTRWKHQFLQHRSSITNRWFETLLRCRRFCVRGDVCSTDLHPHQETDCETDER